jgi:hypothetical protein
LKINQKLGLVYLVILLVKPAMVIQVFVQVVKLVEDIFKVGAKSQLASKNAFKEHML